MPKQKGKLGTVVALVTIATSIAGLLTWLGIRPDEWGETEDSIIENLPISENKIERTISEELRKSDIPRGQWQDAVTIGKFYSAIGQATLRVLEKGENFERYTRTIEGVEVSFSPKAIFTDSTGRTCRKLSTNIDWLKSADKYSETFCLKDGEWTRR